MRNNPLGRLEGVAGRLIRDDMGLTKRMRQLVGPSVAEAIRQANGYSAIVKSTRESHKQHAVMGGVDWGAPKTVRRALRLDHEWRQALQHVASTTWAESIQDTARDIARLQPSLGEHQLALGGALVEAAKTYQTRRAALDPVIRAVAASGQYRDFIGDQLPRIELYGAIAAQIGMIDVATLRGSPGSHEMIVSEIARAVIEVRNIAEVNRAGFAGGSNS